MTSLEQHIQSFFGIPEADLQTISSFFTTEQLKKGDFFLKTGRYSDRMGFVQSGILREFVHVNEKEITKWISTEGYFVLDLSAFIFRHPSRWNIQALTDAEIHVITYDNYKKIGTVVRQWPELEKRFIAKCFAVLEDRVVQQLSLTAEERYQQLFQFNPALFNQVPLQYLASMLGMTPETFSRIRNKSSKKTS